MAAGDAGRAIRNAPYRILFPMRNTADALVAGETVAPFISVASGSFSTPANAVTEIASSGIYYLDITAAELTTASNASFYATSSNATPFYAEIPFEPCAESGVAQASTSSSVTLRSTANSNNDWYNGLTIEIVRGTGAGQTRTITDYTGSSNIASIDHQWNASGNPDTTSVYKLYDVGNPFTITTDSATNDTLLVEADLLALNNNTTAASLMALFTEGMAIASSVNDGSATTTSWTPAAGLSASDDVYNGAICLFTSGNNIGLARQVLDWDGDGDPQLFTMAAAFPFAPGNGDKFVIFGKVF